MDIACNTEKTPFSLKNFLFYFDYTHIDTFLKFLCWHSVVLRGGRNLSTRRKCPILIGQPLHVSCENQTMTTVGGGFTPALSYCCHS